ncbi:hypothetical protein AGDE_14047 [Angomonas deanei]|uniref:EIF3F/CSN6-like C-terminal domain-containing protein n=1 Tax=Angomonas deanei TaxID=59799 RepID=A0A7G2CV21_9TRYP|nr:hypothetical protein AGDE_14047 [Angomonas deanei]CAD2222931.1 hypothetical protein, conserved [Angomonas deanei]|eukprot:EPY21520.1 hypothetical protein AGDE_14047 [Angomonas deanei]
MFLQNEFTHEQLLWRYLLLNNNKNTGNSFLLEKEMMEKVETLKITFPECEVVGFYFVSTSNRVRDIAAFAVDFIQEKFLKLFYPSVLTNPNNNTLFYMLIGNEHPSRGNFTNVFEFQYNSNQNNNGNDQKLEIALHTCEETLCLTGSVDMPLTSLYHPQKQPSVHFLHINFKLDSDEIEFIGIDAVSYISLQKLNSNPKSNVTKNKTAQQLNSVNYLRQHIKIVLQYLELLRQKSPAEVSFQEYDVLRTLQTMVAQLPVESPGYTFHESTFNASINNNKNENHNHNHKHYPNAVQDEINNARSVALLSQLTHLTEEVERLGQQQRGVISQWHGRMEEGNDTKRRKHF